MSAVASKVLVTGAAGFIGSHLAERLVRDGYSVRALIHYNFQNSWGWLDTLADEVKAEMEVFAADVCDPFGVAKAVDSCAVVYHLAALISIPYSYAAPASYVETNVKGTLNILEASRRHDVERIVHTSTSEVYGSARYTPIDESHPLVAQSPYAASKIAADKLAESYCLSYGLPVATLRPFNTFGPRQSARAVIPTIISQALSGAPEIKLGSLEPVRDLNYVADTVEGFKAAGSADTALGKVINCGRGSGVTVGELAEMILQICGSDAAVVASEERKRPPGSEVNELICDNSRAKKQLYWSPTHTLEEGLELTVAWMRENLEYYKTDLYNI